MGLLFSLGGDIFAFVLIWRCIKLLRKPHEKMFETEADFKRRRSSSVAIIIFCVIAIIANHLIFGF